MIDSAPVTKLLKQNDAQTRLELLATMRQAEQWLPLSLAQDLMCLKLSDNEHIAILRSTCSKHSLAFEDYLTRQIMEWNQNVASAALWEWALRSDRLLWHRLIAISSEPHISQRLAYTLVDLAWTGGGPRIIASFARKPGLEDMSPAFLALLYFRALQWNLNSDRLLDIAKSTVEVTNTRPTVPEKILPYALAYLYRFAPEWSQSLATKQGFNGIWSQFHGAAFSELQQEIRLKNCLALQKQKRPSMDRVIQNWPPVWERHKINSDTAAWFLKLVAQHSGKIAEPLWAYFAGIQSQTLMTLLENLQADEELFLLAIRELHDLLDDSQQTSLHQLISQRLQQTPDLTHFMQQLPKKLAAFINSQPDGKSPYDLAYQEQQATLAQKTNQNINFIDLGYEHHPVELDDPERRRFFDTAYRGRQTSSQPVPKGDAQSDWEALRQAWLHPDPEHLNNLSAHARQMPVLFQLCYINTLGRFHNIDNAALKLLDYIRSPEENVLRGVIYALAGIGTNRATQELVAFLTRPNVSLNLQLEITQLLQDADLGRLQSELRSAINDLQAEPSANESLWELREALTSLLTVDEPGEEKSVQPPTDQPTTEDLDRRLRQRIPSYDLLSGEAKRALRTAQFFQLQVSTSGNLRTIDLSPAIDMQYKALELSFREKFEEITGTLIRQGTLQRKLDVIGYARPIPRAMDEFERYIEKLPVIKTIPFFSRFKLRKMLRAICQFRPGKRFTLDGLKAFALFFICFSRSECRYGLDGLLPIPGMSDEELFQFCKALHVFQDFRNRAAHEGFHPDASHDLDGIWVNTSSIIEGMVQIESAIKNQMAGKSSLKTG
jgi:hypothetical protein